VFVFKPVEERAKLIEIGHKRALAGRRRLHNRPLHGLGNRGAPGGGLVFDGQGAPQQAGRLRLMQLRQRQRGLVAHIGLGVLQRRRQGMKRPRIADFAQRG